MPPNRNQSRIWFVECRLAALVGDGITPSDAEIRYCIKNITDWSNTCRRTRRGVCSIFLLRTHSGILLQGQIWLEVNLHRDYCGCQCCRVRSHESVRETTVQSWIQDPRVMDQRWTPVSITPGAGSNWMQQDVIKNFWPPRGVACPREASHTAPSAPCGGARPPPGCTSGRRGSSGGREASPGG
jgi:hypothetical protein